MNESTETAQAEPTLRNTYVELLILSATALYLELLVIRWMSSDIRAFSVFRTFPLVTCFVGLGVGYALGQDRLLKLAPWGLALLIVMIKICEYTGISLMFFPSTGTFNWQDVGVLGQSLWAYVAMFMGILVLVLAGPFAAMLCLGSRLGVLFNRGEPLKAYCVDIGGSIMGSMIFVLATLSGANPTTLLIPVLLVLVTYIWKGGVAFWKGLLPAALCVLLGYVNLPSALNSSTAGVFATYWTPYQRIDVSPLLVDVTKDGKPVKVNLGAQLCVNRILYQFVLDLSPDKINPPGLSEKAKETLQYFRGRYLIPYAFGHADDVMVVGAGTGNDVAEALRQGAKSVDAVDIDPVILKLGTIYNPAQPYKDPRVTRHCDDARHFFNTTKKKYDRIVFGLLDSQSASGAGSSMRLDNYVFTSESVKQALGLLKPNGLIVMSFGSVNDWIPQRLYWTVKNAAGYEPIVIQNRGDWACTVYVAGPPVQEGRMQVPESLKNEALDMRSTPPARILTDDWPYLYLKPVGIDVPYMLVILEVLLLSAYAGRKVLFSRPEITCWQMFFLGAGFILLELQSIARLALLFGSTWVTSAIVINGVLVMILLANLLVIKARKWMSANMNLLYIFMLASLIISYLLPVHGILSNSEIPPALGQSLVTVLTLLPMFVAGMIFASSFGATKNAGRSLGFNLLGAVIGAMLEYLSTVFGINGLVLVSIVLYACSWACARPSIQSDT